MAVPGCPSPAFWMASMASVRTVSTASRSRPALCSVVVVTAAPGDDGLVVWAARHRPGYRCCRARHRQGAPRPAACYCRCSSARRASAPWRTARSRRTTWVAIGSSPSPGCCRCQLPSSLSSQILDVMLRDNVQDLLEAGGELGVVHRRDHLDAHVEVARHEVGGADVELLLPAVGEHEHAGVLEEAPHDGAHPDVVADPWHARPQAAVVF